MALNKALSAAVIVGALGLGGLGPIGAVASAAPAVPAPQKPGHNDFCPPWCNGPQGPKGPKHDRGHDRHDDKGPWWASNRHDWWDDRQGPPPWGWGPPPPYHWAGGPPRPFKYWGYDVNPVWDDGFRQWGIWLFGLWIPIFGIGVA
ncbi:hypothetical protein SAMN04489835_4032 [Mycolicibacterium rutilum]|uniref:Uncharacterized protein n=1 Tax=Mycolicibacterium rutilum TaxID=370526 RepID=A0A1H6L1A9_MYCRU|nr:hypothetical protein [Mycolicibacterium rutilum]SEH77906.1 hypothetical protein SAMN04489835_4032 [Mycolicibacterium rutilum]